MLKPKHSPINCNGKLLDLSTPAVMGIINITPDSFYQRSREMTAESVVEKARIMIEAGASILDLGGQSTRPGATLINAAEEAERVLPAVKVIAEAFPEIILSVDTFYASVAQKAAECGADMINDISGGQFDEDMFSVIARLGLPYVLMHTPEKPDRMQEKTNYANVIEEVYDYLEKRLLTLDKLGVTNVIIDPGFGFGKTLEQNYQLLDRLGDFQKLGKPILCGISRKSMVNNVLNTSALEALNGTSILNSMCVDRGADILRVHDVKEAIEVVKIHSFARTQSSQ